VTCGKRTLFPEYQMGFIATYTKMNEDEITASRSAFNDQQLTEINISPSTGLFLAPGQHSFSSTHAMASITMGGGAHFEQTLQESTCQFGFERREHGMSLCNAFRML
jgi:hypothetical protein